MAAIFGDVGADKLWIVRPFFHLTKAKAAEAMSKKIKFILEHTNVPKLLAPAKNKFVNMDQIGKSYFNNYFCPFYKSKYGHQKFWGGN